MKGEPTRGELRGSPRDAPGPTDAPALLADLQGVLLVLLHLGPQAPHRVLEL